MRQTPKHNPSCCIFTHVLSASRYIKIYNFYHVFPAFFHVPVAILESRQVTGEKFFRHLVGQPYLGKVTKAHPQIPSGYGAAEKRSVWGVNLPSPGYLLRVNASFTVWIQSILGRPGFLFPFGGIHLTAAFIIDRLLYYRLLVHPHDMPRSPKSPFSDDDLHPFLLGEFSDLFIKLFGCDLWSCELV